MKPVTDEALTFECAGERLIGIVSRPAADCKLGVLIIVGGAQYRAGSHRQFLLLARRLAGEGIPVMRFDYRGMGDSSGAVQTFEDTVPDIASAIDAFMAQCPSLRQVVLWAICDAGPAGLVYWNATADRRVAGIALLNPWVLSQATYAKTRIKEYYLGRFLARDFWMKLVSGRLELGNALRTFGSTLTSARSESGPSAEARLSFVDRMAAGLGTFGGPVLFVLSGADLTAKGFRNFYESDSKWRRLMRRPNVEQCDMPGADHTFSSAVWREEVAVLTLRWLERAFPARGIRTARREPGA